VSGRFLAAAAPTGLVAVVAWSAGGFYPRTWGALLLLDAIAIASVAIVATTVEVGVAARTVLLALVGFAVWQLISRAWAVSPDATILEAERTLVYAGAVAAALLVVTRDRAEALVLGVLWSSGVVTLGGLAEHVLGSGVPNDRLELPIGYANAAGILAAVALLLGLGLASDGRAARRALAAGLTPPAAVALYLSLSRGAVLATLLGLAVLAATTRPPGRLGSTALVGAPACVTVLLAWWAGRFGERGVSFSEALSLAVLACLALVAAWLAARPPRVPLPRVSGRAAVGVGLALAVFILAAIVVGGAREVRVARSAPASQQGAPDRLLTTSTSFRSDYWGVAVEMVRDHPLAGAGAGGFERTWLRERPALLFVRDAHDLYLETAAEVGAVGLALLLLALLAPLAGVGRAVREPAGSAALAAYVALLAHAVLDWDWELPAVTFCTLFLGVALARLGDRGERRRLRARSRSVLLVVAAALGGFAILVHVGNGALADAQDALDRGDTALARRDAARAQRFAPWAAEPWQLLGEADLADGRLAAARHHFRHALDDDPGSWDAWLDLALVTRGEERARALKRAVELNPLAPELDAAGSVADHP
jgi:O-antigen ligase